ncbi:MAG: N-acetylneuraminate synthase family protein, partial [Planctomycetota bacterium]
MIIVVRPGSGRREIEKLKSRIREKGLRTFESCGKTRTVINVIGDVRDAPEFWKSHRCVEEVAKISKPYRLASREHGVKPDIVQVGDVSFGGGHFAVIAGPCAVESAEQIFATAEILKCMGVKILRASAFKPRTSPYDFQGLGRKGLKILKEVGNATGLMVETEVMDIRDVAVAAEYVDMLRVGARNMQNFDLLKELGRTDIPVILKRGMSATVKEFIMAAEYILLSGNERVILCERGIRTFES